MASSLYTQEELLVRKRLRDDFPYYALNCLKIKQKELGGFVPLKFNSAQKYIHARIEEQKRRTGKVRAIILKGRQQGCSTYMEGRIYHNITHNPGTNAFVLAHIDSSADILFKILKKYHDYCPEWIKQNSTKNNASLIEFGKIDSGFSVATAGNGTVGRGDTVHYFHASEAAYYKNPKEIVSGAMGSVSKGAGSEVVIESTANGVGNWFHRKWLDAVNGEISEDDDHKDEYIAIFVPWYWQDEYRRPVKSNFERTEEEEELAELYNLSDEQLNWRRNEIRGFAQTGVDGTKIFRQEYPNTPTEAFQDSGEDTFITPTEVSLARKRGRLNLVPQSGPLIIGVDPARSEKGDRTAIIRRRGRCAFGLETYRGKGPMELSGMIHRIIEDEKPEKVFIDGCQLGHSIVDRLRELGHTSTVVMAVNTGATENLLYPVRYRNKRAEIWAMTKKWLTEDEVSIPDSDELHADLCGPKYKHDSNSRLLIESKEDMKKLRHLPSSDTADALHLTFSQPIAPKVEGKTLAEKSRIVQGAALKASKLRQASYKNPYR